jgi:hypothetical protein
VTAPHPALLELAAGRPLPAVQDPQAVTRSAHEHRMQGLLLSGVLADGRWPAEAVGALARSDLRTRAHHQRLAEVLADVVARLGAHDLEVATFKGVSSEARWYDRVGERPCTDIDLLVRPGTPMRRIIDVLQPDHPLRDVYARQADAGVLQSVDLLVDGVEVDVHADLLKVEIPTRGLEAMWRRTTVVDGLRVLDAETALVHLLLHLTKDRFARLLGYADVARIVRREALDWARVDAIGRREGLEVHVAAALHAVTDALDLPPAPLPRPRGPRAGVHRLLWGPATRLQGVEGFIAKQHRQLWVPITARGRQAEALRWWLRRRVLPPADLVDVFHPDTSGPYPWRLLVGRRRRGAERRAHLRQVAGRP